MQDFPGSGLGIGKQLPLTILLTKASHMAEPKIKKGHEDERKSINMFKQLTSQI